MCFVAESLDFIGGRGPEVSLKVLRDHAHPD